MCSEKDPLYHLRMVQMDGIFGFFTERDWSQEYCHGNNIVDVILFLLKNTAPIFLERYSKNENAILLYFEKPFK